MLSNQVATLMSPRRRTDLYRSLLSRLARNQWMFADQALVSGMNFLTTALLARMLGIRNFGIFSVLYIVLTWLNSIQAAVIFSPMMSLAPQITDADEYRSFMRGMAGYQYLFSIGCTAAAALFALLQALRLVPHRMEAVPCLPYVLTIFCFQVQDWFRRFCYVQDRGRSAFLNDVVSYVGQVAIFGGLWWAHRIDVNSAYYAIAATSLAAFGIGFAGDDIRSSWRECRKAAARTWQSGRSLLVATQFQWLGAQGIVLLIAALVGVSAASGIRAVVALMGPVYVLYQLLDNVIPVRAARIYASGGEDALVSYFLRTGALLAVVVGGPILIAAVFARPIMSTVFGRAYAEFAALVVWEAIYTFLALLYRGLQYYHRTMNTTVVLARSAMIVAVLSVSVCLALSRRYGAAGGMAALVTGQVVNVSIPLMSARRSHRRLQTAS